MDARTLKQEGNALAQKKDWAQALESYRSAAALDPGDSDLHFLIGCCHFKLNHGPGARVAWEKTLALDPNHSKARQWIHRVTGMSFETPVSA